MSEEMVCRKHRLSSFQIIILGFAGVILLGALLLMLPLSTATILTMYLALFFGGGVFISVYEDLPLSSCLYEAASAVGTVGLTLGITPQLHIPSQMVLIALMYLGRVGGLTLIYAAVSSKKTGSAKLPQESITIG